MRVRESKNLNCDRMPIEQESERETLNPRICILDDFERTDDKLILYFKNRSVAVIRSKNIEGGREMDLVERQLAKMAGHSYEEILNIVLDA